MNRKSGRPPQTPKQNKANRITGNKIRARRLALGLSQEKLGVACNVSFQQIQKYENGTNNIATSRLQEIARVLKVPLEALLPDGSESNGGSNLELYEFLATKEGSDMFKAMLPLSKPMRRMLVEIVRVVVNHQGLP